MVYAKSARWTEQLTSRRPAPAPAKSLPPPPRPCEHRQRVLSSSDRITGRWGCGSPPWGVAGRGIKVCSGCSNRDTVCCGDSCHIMIVSCGAFSSASCFRLSRHLLGWKTWKNEPHSFRGYASRTMPLASTTSMRSTQLPSAATSPVTSTPRASRNTTEALSASRVTQPAWHADTSTVERQRGPPWYVHRCDSSQMASSLYDTGQTQCHERGGTQWHERGGTHLWAQRCARRIR